MSHIPKYLQRKFQKATTTIKPEHQRFIKDLIKEFNSFPSLEESGAAYCSKIKKGYRVFRKKDKLFVMMHPDYYLVNI